MLNGKFLIAIAAAVFSFSPAAHAQIPTTDVAALVEAALQLESMYEQLMEVKTMVDQGEQMVNEAKNAANSLQNSLGSALNANQYSEIQSLRNLGNQTNSTYGWSDSLKGTVSDVAKKLQDAYGSDAGGTANQPEFDKYMTTTKDTIRGAVTNNAATMDSFDSEARRLDNLVGQSQGATGALQAQQAGNQINAELTSQIQKLRQQQAVQAQAANAAALAQQQQAESKAAITMWLLDSQDSK